MRDRVPALAQATLLEALRDRILAVVVVFAVALVLVSRAIGWLSVEDEHKIVLDLSLSGLSLLVVLLAMLVGAFSLAREMERRTAYSVLTRDLGRGEFVVGKFLGLTLAFWLCLLLAAGVLVGWAFLWGAPIGPGIGAAVLGLMAEVVLLTAVALFLGSLMTPAIAAVGTFVFYAVAHSMEALRDLAELGANEFAGLWGLLYTLLPNLEDVNYLGHAGSARPVEWGSLGIGAVAVLCWGAVFLGGAAALFRRREF